jgi:hypothetical protein
MTTQTTTTVETTKPKATPKPRAARVTKPVVPKDTAAVVTTTTKAAVKPRATAKPAVRLAAKAATEFKPKTMSLVAGLAVALSHKKLSKALGYHSKTTGCIEKTTEGSYTLTALGQQAWEFQRVAKNPALFQEIANFVKRAGPVPSLWKNQPPLEVAPGVQLPNPVFWGSFSSSEMRLAFAAIWSK